MRYLIALLILVAGTAYSGGVWQYCGTNANATEITLVEKSGSDLVFTLEDIPGGTTSLDILMSPDPSEIGRFHKVVRDASISVPTDTITYTPLTHYSTNLFFYIVDDSANYKQARRDSAGACE